MELEKGLVMIIEFSVQTPAGRWWTMVRWLACRRWWAMSRCLWGCHSRLSETTPVIIYSPLGPQSGHQSKTTYTYPIVTCHARAAAWSKKRSGGYSYTPVTLPFIPNTRFSVFLRVCHLWRMERSLLGRRTRVLEYLSSVLSHDCRGWGLDPSFGP